MRLIAKLFVKKYEKAMDQIKKSNMTKTMFDEFHQERKDHQTALAIPFADVRNYHRLRERAEGELLLTNEVKHDYAVTAGQLIFLNSRDAP